MHRVFSGQAEKKKEKESMACQVFSPGLTWAQVVLNNVARAGPHPDKEWCFWNCAVFVLPGAESVVCQCVCKSVSSKRLRSLHAAATYLCGEKGCMGVSVHVSRGAY